ncbi:MAG: hypothetical protein FWG34_14575, partial [Oscillospiraceae bacterium]|nr:hypothetical protein [Oscillospiraceae bacterium]
RLPMDEYVEFLVYLTQEERAGFIALFPAEHQEQIREKVAARMREQFAEHRGFGGETLPRREMETAILRQKAVEDMEKAAKRIKAVEQAQRVRAAQTGRQGAAARLLDALTKPFAYNAAKYGPRAAGTLAEAAAEAFAAAGKLLTAWLGTWFAPGNEKSERETTRRYMADSQELMVDTGILNDFAGQMKTTITRFNARANELRDLAEREKAKDKENRDEDLINICGSYAGIFEAHTGDMAKLEAYFRNVAEIFEGTESKLCKWADDFSGGLD